ncbi:MAG: archaeosortase/exosortase family protein, partial [Pseudomonadota bacterium]
MLIRNNTSLLALGIMLTLSLAILSAWDGIVGMVRYWERDEYSYGYFVPALIAFFIWQRKNQLARVDLAPSWWGILLALIGIGIITLGELAT